MKIIALLFINYHNKKRQFFLKNHFIGIATIVLPIIVNATFVIEILRYMTKLIQTKRVVQYIDNDSQIILHNTAQKKVSRIDPQLLVDSLNLSVFLDVQLLVSPRFNKIWCIQSLMYCRYSHLYDCVFLFSFILYYYYFLQNSFF